MASHTQQDTAAQLANTLQRIVQSLVDNEAAVVIRSIVGEQTITFEITAAKEDIGKVIGKQGRTSQAIRTLAGTWGMKHKVRVSIEILE